MERRILLADADAFFVAVARLVDPEGAGRVPLLIVGGTRESRGVVCSASYEARRYGVRSAMSIAQALRLCPAAMCVPIPGKACGQKSREIRAVLMRFTPVVAGASVDEWYCDMSGTEGLYQHEPLEATARRMREAVLTETGMSVSLGGGTNRLIAKLAVERAKPKSGTGGNGVFIVPPGAEAEFMKTCALAEIPFVGPKFQQRLATVGLTKVTDVLEQSLPTLERWLGETTAAWLWDRAHGIADSTVEAGRAEAKSISRDETFPNDLHADADLERELLRLVTRAAADMRGDGLRARTVCVRIRDKDFKTRSARKSLKEAVVSDRVIMGVAKEMLAKLRAKRRVPARLLGVALSGLSADPKADQAALLPAHVEAAGETERDRQVARAVDRVREKFGRKGIVPAALTRP